MKIAVIGAGAAGLIASAILKQKGCDFTLYERADRAGKKLLATGNGRCNIANIGLSEDRYHGDRAFAKAVLDRAGYRELVAFYESIGIFLTNEGDKVYPSGFQASAVLDLLRLAEGTSERCSCEVTALSVKKNGIGVVTAEGETVYDKVIVATGGKAAKKLSGGGAYGLLTSLGHKETAMKPAIVQLVTGGTKALEGIKVNATATLSERAETGEVLFTSYGLSGPPILQLSRDAKGKTLTLDLMPEADFPEVLAALCKKRDIRYLTAENLFTGYLNKKVGREILKLCGVLPLSRPVAEITDREMKKIASFVKKWPFEITGTQGFDNAQVTAGGISCEEFCPETMESRLVPGLYAAGELLDVDGDCGGFNLQWAFSTAYLAAVSAGGEKA